MGPQELETVLRLGVAVLLGALVGFQRETEGSHLGGVRTFPLVALLGAFAGLLPGPWLMAAGLLALAAVAVFEGRGAAKDKSGGITTEVALLATYLIGAYAAGGSLTVAGVAAAAVAALLQSKPELHGAVDRLSPQDIRAIIRFAVLAMVVLPLLPDKAYGPGASLNPREAWLMVVLVVGLNLAGFISYKFIGKRGGMYSAGLLGGMISSTATTFGSSRQAAKHPGTTGFAAGTVALACAVVFGRIIFELGVVSPAVLLKGAVPMGLALLAAAAFAAGVLLWTGREAEGAVEPKNPGGFLAAAAFGIGYAVVGLLLELAPRHMAGSEWAVAAVAGLTDVDAVTLSTGRLAHAGSIPPDTAWRLALLAASSNTLFKAGLVSFMSGGVLAVRVGLPLVALSAVCATIAFSWR